MFRRPPLLHVGERSGTGAPVVLLHGIASSSETFENLVPLLRDAHEVIAIDLLGFGGSPAPEDSDYTVEDHVGAITRTIRHLRIARPFTLVGHSMGALFTARIAARHSRWLSSAVLVSPPIYLAPEELSDRMDQGAMDVHLRAYRFLREHRDFTLHHAALAAKMIRIPGFAQLDERSWTPFIRSLEHTIETQTSLSDLAATSVPVTIVYGELDEFRSRGALQIVSRLTGVTVRKVPGSHHLIDHRLAAAVAEAIDGVAEPARIAHGGRGTRITWAMRRGTTGNTFGGGKADALPARGVIGQRAAGDHRIG
jgi:pimeloyl-ACP methyl ester carboxylesterase